MSSHRIFIVDDEPLLRQLLERHVTASWGHTARTFPDAGEFELAHTGTLFRNEIGEMDMALQAKLLPVIQQREFDRVGGAATVRVDVCIVSATNRDLQRAVPKRYGRPVDR